MRHLYLRIYFTIIIILVIFAVLSALLWWLGPGSQDEEQPRRYTQVVKGLTRLAQRALPTAEAPASEIRDVLTDLSGDTGVSLTLRDEQGLLIAHTGTPLELPETPRAGWVKRRGKPKALALQLDDGRWLVGRHAELPRSHRWLVALVLLAIAVAIGAHPIAKRLTRRLERLQNNVEALAAGNLSSRVEVQGNDEIAKLARSFNLAAEQIETLVESQRTVLASASHELRSPLARINVAIALLEDDQRQDLIERIRADITELDALIDELLLASRLDAGVSADRVEVVDMLAVAAEECARVPAKLSGNSAMLNADPRLMHRIVRNLLQNAVRYGAGSDIEVSVEPDIEGKIVIRVSDRGPGVPSAEREKIFEPFYRPSGMRESGEGVGLGLSLVRKIANSYGGYARCLPRPGGGTIFEIAVCRELK